MREGRESSDVDPTWQSRGMGGTDISGECWRGWRWGSVRDLQAKEGLQQSVRANQRSSDSILT